MNKKILIMLFIGILCLLIWFLLFFRISYEEELLIFKYKNTIYCLSIKPIQEPEINLKIENSIYTTTLNFVKKQNSWNIYFIDNNSFNLEDEKVRVIKLIKNISIINTFF